jgi:rhamnosyltransferase
MAIVAGAGIPAERAAGVVVTFHPDESVPDRIESLSRLVASVIVIDNASCEEDLDALGGREISNIRVVALGRNEGIASALNLGFEMAKEAGFDWVVAMDQDSDPLPELIEAASKAVHAHPRPEKVAAIGALVKPATPPERDTPSYRTSVAVITSGTVYSIAGWAQLGGFRSDYFIDCVDTEYCLRARKRGWTILTASRVGLRHNIGNPTRVRALGRWMMPTNHSPMRRYYMTRNRISMWGRYLRSDFRFVRSDMRQTLREWIGIAFAETHGRAKARAILRGLADGLLGRYGARWIPTNPHGGAPRPETRAGAGTRLR